MHFNRALADCLANIRKAKQQNAVQDCGVPVGGTHKVRTTRGTTVPLDSADETIDIMYYLFYII